MLIHSFLTIFTFVELNCENLFDCSHDSLKQDWEFCEGGSRYWNFGRYWRKLNSIGREIISCGGEGESWRAPDLVALVEVENDSVLTMLTTRSLLGRAHYQYVMTNSADERGVDVALLYNPSSFSLTNYYSIRPDLGPQNRPTRDILYVCGTTYVTASSTSSQTYTETQTLPLHIFVVHAPSRRGGKAETEPLRMAVSKRLCQSIDSLYAISPDARIIVAGDFNNYHNDKSVKEIENHGFTNISANALGTHGALGTYRYQGEWGSLDQILISHALEKDWNKKECYIHDPLFLTEEDEKYGGRHPRRTFNGFKYDAEGFSDHLPLVLKMSENF